MRNVFLVQSVDTGVFKKLAKEGVKTRSYDCFAQVTTYFVCNDKLNAVEDCRKYNRKQAGLIYFVADVPLY